MEPRSGHQLCGVIVRESGRSSTPQHRRGYWIVRWVCRTHRWLSMAFTVAVIINIVAVAQKKYSDQLGLLAVFPLALLLVTGLVCIRHDSSSLNSGRAY